ncbi:DUF1576 domain-containing protein [Proteiniborus sp. MB09-C3]|uniref:DUF1576 domain-containing protein n=1 Tax=Proteiniborus sp. MB09-C3 TaxID=3050072 RepID=UPI002557A54C|nr:DUF1576 domain-containing protein [Proteiniborus sp. MB09-C3]WIV13303.1 DUF1576 domain-containing protein [Proteiniborus sp. MB09-C3]
MTKENLSSYKQVSEKTKFIIISIFPVASFILAFFVSDFNEIINGLYKIIIQPDVLITDYIKVGGLGAALMNSALLTLINIFFLWRLNFHMGGFPISALFIIAGFAFFGKNIFNVWPIYIGGYLYAKQQKKRFRSIIVISMFGTALSPMIFEVARAIGPSNHWGLAFAILAGIVVGFFLPPIASHLLRAHDGYNLYNVGFAAGFIGTVIMSFMKSYGFINEPRMILSTEHDLFLKVFLSMFFILLIVIGYFLNDKSLFKGYTKILNSSGKLVTDFTFLAGFGMTLINMGIMGIIGLAYVFISKGVMNGPIVGGLLTIVGFASFGKHPKNCIPVMLGVFIASIFKVWGTSSTTVIIAALFSTSLCPIAGEYGAIAGIIAGFIHLSVTMNVGVLHGGINLYNNGFSTGIIATLLVPMLDVFKRRNE